MAVTIEQLHGRMVDLDSHLQLPFTELKPFFGEAAARLGERRAKFGMRLGQSILAGDSATFVPPDRIDEVTVWTSKGHAAPGAHSADTRLTVLDIMGIDRQLIFPMVVVAGAAWRNSAEGLETMRRYNDFVVEWSAVDPRRLRASAVLNMHDAAIALEEARRVIARGCRAILLPCDQPPGGTSPADPTWDGLWATLSDADVPAVFHIGGNAGFLSGAWTPSKLEAQAMQENPDEANGPFELSTAHLAAQVYLSSMILGGVFERHPALRVAAVEMGGQWIGPMAELLDQRTELFKRRMGRMLTMRPSEYVNRNVRVTPGFFEPIDTYIERFGLEDVYAFSTDYPHPEGGVAPIPELFDRAKRLGDRIVEKLFVSNAELILPDA